MKNIEQDITNGKNGEYLRNTYGEEAEIWARKVLDKQEDDYATNLGLAKYTSQSPIKHINKSNITRQALAREILERNIYQKPFSKSSKIDKIPIHTWLELVKKAIGENKHIPEITLKEYNSLKSEENKMKNPQNYKKYYAAFNKVKVEILNSIKDMLSNLPVTSIAFNEGFLSTCTLGIVDEDKSVIAMGIVLKDDFTIIVHAGIYGPEQTYDARSLDLGRLIRLYKVFEEAYYEYPIEPYEE